MLRRALKRQDFVQKCALNKSGSGTGTGTGARNWNQNFSNVGTGAAVNHYGSTALDHWYRYRWNENKTELGLRRMKSFFAALKIIATVSNLAIQLSYGKEIAR